MYLGFIVQKYNGQDNVGWGPS